MRTILIAIVTFLAVAAIQTPAYAQASSVITYGADPTGTSDSTAAFTNAATANDSVTAPCGTFLVNWVVASKAHFSFSGAGTCTWLEPYVPGTDVIRITGGNFSTFKNFSVADRGSAGSGNGITLAQGQSNTRLEHIYISGFTGSGISVVGTASNQLSGNDVIGSTILNNRTAGISYVYSNDFHIMDNNIGDNTTYGIYQASSSAGQVIGNFIWQNGIGVYSSGSNFGWWSRNRLTQSNMQGFVCASCNYATVTDNQSYQNSNGSLYAAEDWKFTGANGLIFTGNNAFDWTGSAHTSYGLTIDGTSQNVIIENNQFSLHKIASANIDPAALNVKYTNNLPGSDVTVNNCASGALMSGNSGSTAVGGTGATVYLGGSQSSNEGQTTFPVVAQANVCTFGVFVSSVPGAGQSYTFTLRKNGVSTGITGSISGTGSFAANVTVPSNAISVTQGDALDIMMTSSAGAAPSAVRYSIAVAPQ